MPRKLRIQYPGAIYHFMNRGDRREDRFLDDLDRQDFLKTLPSSRVTVDCSDFRPASAVAHFRKVVQPR